jgi:hypothetical protein
VWWIRKSSANAFTGTLHRSRRALSSERRSLLSSFLSLVDRKRWFLRNVQHPHRFFRTAQDQLSFVITFIYALYLRLQCIYGGERSNTKVIEHYFLQSVPAPVNWLPWYKRAKSLKCIAWSLSGRRTRSWSLESGNKLNTTIQYGMFVSSSSKRGPICNMCEHRVTLSQPIHGIVISMSFIAMFTNTSDAYEGNAMRART